jgi:hypothetical protein
MRSPWVGLSRSAAELQPSNSPSWKPAGDVNVLSALSLLSLSGEDRTTVAQLYGTVYVGLVPDSAESVILSDHSVAGLASKTFFMTLFGLSNAAFKLGEGATTTFLTNSCTAGSGSFLPSLSLSYTAGSYARK